MRSIHPHVCLVLLLLLIAAGGRANNVQVANANLTGNTGTYAFVQFDLSWENSWRSTGTGNWDAAWVFAKYRTAAGTWQHVRLNNAGHTAPAIAQIALGLLTPTAAYNATTNPVLGTFIHRAADGSGTFALAPVRLRWDYSLSGLAYADILEVRVYAIEMVLVTQGAYYLGSGGTEDGSFTNGAWVSGPTIPLQITSENALAMSAAAGNLWGTSTSGINTIGPVGTLPATFPKGFAPFYCMKYEMSQQAYVDVLNTLTYAQQTTRTWSPPDSPPGTGLVGGNFDRFGIAVRTSGVASGTPAVYGCNLNGNTTYGEPSDGMDIACNFTCWGDVAAYLDWSALRPMTELELEKTCRGPVAPLANEYPWGTQSVAAGAYTLVAPGFTNEGIATNYSTTGGNAQYNAIPTGGPLRVGIFAAHAANSGRMTAGAGYYGVMDLAGNLLERPVVVCTVEGRAFAGTHGNGMLSASGSPDVPTWPAEASALGAGFRGSSWSGAATSMRVSDRFAVAFATNQRQYDYGGRGVRSAP